MISSPSSRHDASCVFLLVLLAEPASGAALPAVCHLLELRVARRPRLGQVIPGVQLAPCPHGVGSGGSVRHRWVFTPWKWNPLSSSRTRFCLFIFKRISYLAKERNEFSSTFKVQFRDDLLELCDFKQCCFRWIKLNLKDYITNFPLLSLKTFF